MHSYKEIVKTPIFKSISQHKQQATPSHKTLNKQPTKTIAPNHKQLPQPQNKHSSQITNKPYKQTPNANS